MAMRELWQEVLDELLALHAHGRRLAGAWIRLRQRSGVQELSCTPAVRAERERLAEVTRWVEDVSRRYQGAYDECVFAMEIEGEIRLDYHHARRGYHLLLGIPLTADGRLDADGIYGKDRDLAVECLANLNYRREA